MSNSNLECDAEGKAWVFVGQQKEKAKTTSSQIRYSDLFTFFGLQDIPLCLKYCDKIK